MSAILYICYVLLAIVFARIAVPAAGCGSLELKIYTRTTRFVWFGLAFFIPFLIVGFLQFLSSWFRVSVSSALTIQCLMVGCAYYSRVQSSACATSAEHRDPGPTSWRDSVQALGILAILVFATCSIILALGFPRGFEATAYHVPLGVEFFKSGSLLPWDGAHMHTFPANMSIFVGFLLQFLPERLVSLANMPFLLLGCFVVYCLARSLLASHSSSLLSAIGLTTLPIVAFGAFELQSDLAGMAFVGMGIVICLTAPESSRMWPLAAGAAAGLAFGFKSLHLVGSAYIGLVVLGKSMVMHGAKARRGRLRSATAACLLFGSGFFLTSGYWLIRNWVELGNPLYPIHIGGVFDRIGWAKAPDVDYLTRISTQNEWVQASWEWILYPWREWHYLDDNFKSSSGLGAFFAAGVPLATAFSAFSLFERIPDKATDEAALKYPTAVLLLGTILIVAVWWLMQDRQPRYLMGAIILVLPLVARLVDGTQGAYRTIVRSVLVASCVLMFFVILSTMVADAGSRFVINKQHDRAAFYEYPKAIDDLPLPNRILNMGPRPKNYALYGDKLANDVLSYYIVNAVTDGAGNLKAEELAKLGVTHVYNYGHLNALKDDRLALEIVDLLETNPANNVKLPKPVVLYRVTVNSPTE
jgi:hypothetical protein